MILLTTKQDAIKELLRLSYGNRNYEEYGGFIVYENMESTYGYEDVSPPYPDATTIAFYDECEELTSSTRSEIISLGFTLENVDHQIPINGTLHDRRCYIKWNNQHFTRSDLYLDRIKEKAESLGYDVRTISEFPYWGIYGNTSGDAVNQFANFCNEVGLVAETNRAKPYDSGYIAYAESWYLNSLYSIISSTPSQPVPTKKIPKEIIIAGVAIVILYLIYRLTKH